MKPMQAAFVSGLASLAVLGIHTDAQAQQTAPPPPAPQAQQEEPPQSPPVPAPESAAPPGQGEPGQGAEYPPGYGPPPGYPAYAPPPGYAAPPARYYYPPPRYYGPHRYAYYPPPPPAAAYSMDRPFMLGGSLGLGTLHYHLDSGSTSEAALGYSLRLGFGLAPRILFLIEINGATAGGSDTYADSVAYDQTIYDLGLQVFLTRRFFLRGGAGIGNIRAFDYAQDFTAKVGFGVTASAGVELMQGYNWSFELAAQWITGFYSHETWTSGAVNIGFNFF